MATRTALLLLRSAILAGMLATATVGVAAAKDPKDQDVGTGIDTHRPPGPIEFYVTSEHVKEKELRIAQFAEMLRRNGGLTIEAVPSMINLTDYKIFHQKTSYFCVPAVVQSIASHKFGGYTSPTIKDAQYAIAKEINTTTSGTWDPYGRSWLNRQFYLHGSDFRYIGTRPDWANFTNAVMADLFISVPLYARVDLSSGYYTWFQPKRSDGGHVFHATAVVGYKDSGVNAISGDPFKVQAAPDKACTGWDGGAANYGCRWGISPNPSYGMRSYFNALDKIQTIPSLWF